MSRTFLAPILESGLTTGGAGTAVFVRIRGSDGALWNTSGTPAFETFNASKIANYAITATEIGSTGIYKGTDPDGTTDGKYLLVVKAGSSLAVSDLVSGLRYEDNALNYLQIIMATAGGDVSGAGSGTEVFVSPDRSVTVTSSVDNETGDRTMSYS